MTLEIGPHDYGVVNQTVCQSKRQKNTHYVDDTCLETSQHGDCVFDQAGRQSGKPSVRQADSLTKQIVRRSTYVQMSHHGSGVVDEPHVKMQLLLERLTDNQSDRQTDVHYVCGTHLEFLHHVSGVVDERHGKMQLLLECLHHSLRFLRTQQTWTLNPRSWTLDAGRSFSSNVFMNRSASWA